MFKNKTVSGRNNIAGSNIAQLRKSATPKMSQRLLADKVQLEGLDLDKNAIQRIKLCYNTKTKSPELPFRGLHIFTPFLL